MSAKQRLLLNGLHLAEGPVYVRLGRAGVDDVTTEGYIHLYQENLPH